MEKQKLFILLMLIIYLISWAIMMITFFINNYNLTMQT